MTIASAVIDVPGMPDDYVIWSFEHDAWWGPGLWGYTHELEQAGRYPQAEADRIVGRANVVAINEVAIRVTEVQMHRYHVVPDHNPQGGDGWAILDLNARRIAGGWFADRTAAEQTAAVLNRSEDRIIIEGKCPFCDWTSRQATGKQEAELVQSYVAKALMGHLRLKHARHDEQRTDNIAFSTILSARTKMGMIEFSLNDDMSQWDLDKAREVHGMLGAAIEAAVSDTLIYQFLVEKVGLADDKAAAALLDFRALRQGSRDPSRGH